MTKFDTLGRGGACAAVIAAFLAVGCGASHSTPGAHSSAADTTVTTNDAGQPVVTANVDTGTGNSFQTTATQTGMDTDGTSFSAGYSVNLSYSDVTGYMNDSNGQPVSQIDMWVSVAIVADNVGPANVPLFYTSNGVYVTSVPFDTVINGIEGDYTPVLVAFVGPTGQWDSNYGQNYDVGIPHP
jgi:hypothetical protein